MKFDAKKALSDAFSTQVSLLDRLVSYLYFADFSVCEQTVLDRFGRGISLVAHKNVEKGGKHCLLATALPVASRFPKSPHEILQSGGHYLDCARFIDIIAKVFVSADITKHKVTILAYRPDLTASCLQEILASLDEKVDFACVYAPVGLTLKRPMVSLSLVEVSFTAKSRRKLMKPTRDVLELRALNTKGKQDFLSGFLALLHDLEARREIQVLSVDANTGSDFFAPSEIVAKVATHVEKPDFPANLEVRELHRAPVHPCSVALDGAIAILETLNKEILSHGEFAHASLYPIQVELVGDTCNMHVVFCADKAISDEVLNKIMNIEGVSDVVTYRCMARDEWDGSPVGSYPLFFRLCENTYVLGTTFEDSMEDPVLAVEKAVSAYRLVLRQFL